MNSFAAFAAFATEHFAYFGSLYEKLKTKRLRIPNKHDALHHTHDVVHCTYLGAVFKEAHGFYGIAAGVLLLVIVAGFFIGEEL